MIEKAGTLQGALHRAARVAVPGGALAGLLALMTGTSAGGLPRLGVGGQGQIAPMALAYCTFNDPNGASLDAYSWADPADIRPGVAQWVEAKNNWDIQNGRAHTTVTNNPDIAVLEIGASDVVVSAAVYPYSGSMGKIFARYQDLTNYWLAIAHRGAQKFQLYRGSSKIAEVATTISTSHVVQLSCIGTSIVATLDGAHELSTTSAVYQAQTICGIGGYKANDYIDNFQVVAG